MHDSAAVTTTEIEGNADGDDVTLAVLDRDVLANLRDLPGEGDDDLLGELIDLFGQDAPPRMAQLRVALQLGDAKRVMHVAHSLKGSSANLGASCMAGICDRLEQQGRAANLDGGTQLQRELEREYSRVMLALQVERRCPA